MKNLNPNKIYAIFTLLLLNSCSTSHYRIYQKNYDNVGIIVTSGRVRVECEDLYAAGGDRPGSFGFLIHVLDEEKTVLTGIQPSQTSKSDCESKVELIRKILKKSEKVYIAGTANLTKPRENTTEFYYFPEYGEFKSNGRVMQWDVLKGTDGTCVTAHYGYGKPCPWVPIFKAESIPF